MSAVAPHIVPLVDRKVDLVRQAVVFPDGSTKSLTTRETQLLSYLSKRPEQDVTRDELLERVWEYRASYATRAVDVAMRRLRAKVEPDPQHPVHLIAVHGVGYRFVPPPNAAPQPELPPSVPAETAEGLRSNLRPPHSSFIGRQRLLDAIGGLWERGARVVSLLGPGGVGKTRLATQHALDRWGDLAGGVWLCELETADGLSGVAAAMGSALRVPLTGDDNAMVHTLGAALAARGDVLVILDGFEHVVNDARDALAAWVEAAPAARFLVTSRERLRLRGEYAVEVGPLSPDEARTLFVDRAQASGARLPTLDDPLLDQISDRLDRLPLAIELAAPRARVLSLEQLHDRLDERFKVLGGTGGGALYKAIEWSWELLAAEERRALAWASVFAGGFTLEAAEDVLDVGGWVLDMVETLRDKSLLHAYEPVEQPGALRFALYESIRAFAQQQLQERGEVEAAEQSHSAYYLQLGDQLSAGIDQRGGLDDFRCLAAEVDNLLAVVRRRAGHPDEVVRAVLALSPVLESRGPYPLYVRLLDQAVTAAEAVGPAMLARLLIERAKVYRVSAEMEAARSDLGRALQITRESGDMAEVEALNTLGLVNADQSRLDEAEALCDQALTLSRASDFRGQEAIALGMLASFHTMRGRAERAERLYLKAIHLHEEIGNARRVALCSANLGLLLLQAGRVDEGEQRLLTALALQREWDDLRRVATTRMGLAVLRGAQRRFDEARDHAETALRLFQEVNYTRFVAHATQNVASLRWAQGDAASALPLLMDAIHHFQEVGDRLYEAIGQAYLAAVLATTDDLVGSEAHLERAEELLRGQFSPQASGIVVVARGFLEAAQSRVDREDAEALRTSAAHKARDGANSTLLAVRFIANLLSDQLDTA